MAWESWCAGSLGIGAVITNPKGNVVARGRNRVLEEAGGAALGGSLLAHAEMDAFLALGLSTAEGLVLYTTVEPCLMCSATCIAMRTAKVAYATADPVFEGLDETLASHSYVSGRLPIRERLDDPLLAGFAAVLPMANRVWSRPGSPPRSEWIQSHAQLWAAANRLINDGTMSRLQRCGAEVDEAVAVVADYLAAHG
jgi:tRNA(adenine34) deaminase